jgi:hypothetical protein
MVSRPPKKRRILLYKQAIIDLRPAMLTRRSLVLTGFTVLVAGAALNPAAAAPPPAPVDPVAILTAIYARVAKGKGDSGGGFVIENPAAKAKYFSKSLVDLWARADDSTPKGDIGPIDFDLVTNSQEPDVKSFKVVAEKLEADNAVIVVTLTSRSPRPKPSDNTIRYNFVKDAGQWKIDDISSTLDGEAWSLRDILTESLKQLT